MNLRLDMALVENLENSCYNNLGEKFWQCYFDILSLDTSSSSLVWSHPCYFYFFPTSQIEKRVEDLASDKAFESLAFFLHFKLRFSQEFSWYTNYFDNLEEAFLEIHSFSSSYFSINLVILRFFWWSWGAKRIFVGSNPD